MQRSAGQLNRIGRRLPEQTAPFVKRPYLIACQKKKETPVAGPFTTARESRLPAGKQAVAPRSVLRHLPKAVVFVEPLAEADDLPVRRPPEPKGCSSNAGQLALVAAVDVDFEDLSAQGGIDYGAPVGGECPGLAVLQPLCRSAKDGNYPLSIGAVVLLDGPDKRMGTIR